MGCAASREKMKMCDLSASNGAMTAAQCVGDGPGYGPVGERTAFLLREKFFSWGGDFKIKDNKGSVAYAVKGQVMTLRDKMVIYNPAGRKVCMMQKKLLTFKPTYWVYTYEPNFPGQASTENDSGEPVYRAAIIEGIFFSFPPRYNYSVYSTSNDSPELLWNAQEVRAAVGSEPSAG